MTPRYIKPGEPIAVLPSFMHQDRKGFFWMLGSGQVANERRGDVAIIHVRGELEHHADPYCYAESYEGIRRKWVDALSGQDVVDAHEREHRWDADYKPITGTPPKAIVMVIDSPGGVVSGLNETVKALQKLRAENPRVRTIAYCNEMAASAAYALACSCERIIAPPSAIVGSVGVISTMVSQARRDQKEGFDVRLLTSGARKADGHLHAPLTDAAVAVEQTRVDKLAMAFFSIVSKARGLSIDQVKALQAGIFLGKDAIASKVKLVDEVKSLDDVIAEATSNPTETVRASGGNQTDRKVRMDIGAMIKRTKAAIAKEKDPTKLAALAMDLAAYERTRAAYKKTEKYVEETVKEEETAEEESEEEESAESESDEEEASAEMPDDEDDDEDDEDDEDEKSSKASLAFRAAVEELTGMRGKKALGALRAIAGAHAENTARIQKLELERKKDRKASLIADAKGKYLTKSEAAWLATQPTATVEGFVAMRRKSGVIVHVDETTIVKPKAVAPGSAEALPPDVLDMIDQAVAATPGSEGAKKALREKLTAAHLAEHTKQISAALNGAGRY